jgi:hypothetical protein
VLGSQVFNALESGLWIAMAVGCGLGSVRCADRYRKTLLVAAATFLAFGVSDVLEIRTVQTGMPWWLWTIKIVCVLALAGCYIAYRRIRSRPSPDEEDSQEGEMTYEQTLNRRIRPLLALFVLGLVLSGLSAVPLQTEANWLADLVAADEPDSGFWPLDVKRWAATVREAITETNRQYPFMAYGTDWLAFAHVIIAVAMIGPFRDPLRNVWVIDFGMVACVAVIPTALIAGALRGIPLWWRLIDCSFGVLGIMPLLAVRCYVNGLVCLRAAEAKHPPPATQTLRANDG